MKPPITITLSPDPSSRDTRGQVLALRVLRTKEVHELDPSQRVFWVGSDPACDVVIVGDPPVSAHHCVLERHEHRLVVRDHASKNGVRIGELVVSESEIPVATVLTVGQTALLALGPHNREECFGTPSMDSFIRQNVTWYGDGAAAARAMGTSARSTQRWAKQGGRTLGTATPDALTVFEPSPVPEPIADDETPRRRRRRPLRGVPIVGDDET